jgi:SAM-dependent methyltransferase
MSLPDSIAIQKYHRDRILKFGAESSRALGWTTNEGQLSRFTVIGEMLGDLSGKSVLDVGCGHGDLRGYFGDKYNGLRYAGIDQVDSFLEVAIERYGHYADTAFYFGDFLKADVPVMDYVVGCGALSYRSADPDFVFKAITKLLGNCRHGLLFNLLKNINSEEKILTGYDPETILKHCRTLSENVMYKDGYFGEDYTVYVNRNK